MHAMVLYVLCVLAVIYLTTVHAEISLETNFHVQATPIKIKPMKICTHEELVTVNTVGDSHPQKFIPLKI